MLLTSDEQFDKKTGISHIVSRKKKQQNKDNSRNVIEFANVTSMRNGKNLFFFPSFILIVLLLSGLITILRGCISVYAYTSTYTIHVSLYLSVCFPQLL